MKSRLVILPLLALLLLFGALAAACSSDDDDTGDSSPTATATEPADDGDDGESGESSPSATATEPADDGDGGNGGGGSGRATLTIGDESWSFDDIFCAFSPEEAQNEFNSFFLSAVGETAEGVRIQLDATILDDEGEGRHEGDGVSHSVSLNDVEDFENPAVAWSASAALQFLAGEDESIIQVDGKSVTAEAVFDDDRTDEIEEVVGSLEATCP